MYKSDIIKNILGVTNTELDIQTSKQVLDDTAKEIRKLNNYKKNLKTQLANEEKELIDRKDLMKLTVDLINGHTVELADYDSDTITGYFERLKKEEGWFSDFLDKNIPQIKETLNSFDKELHYADLSLSCCDHYYILSSNLLNCIDSIYAYIKDMIYSFEFFDIKEVFKDIYFYDKYDALNKIDKSLALKIYTIVIYQDMILDYYTIPQFIEDIKNSICCKFNNKELGNMMAYAGIIREIVSDIRDKDIVDKDLYFRDHFMDAVSPIGTPASSKPDADYKNKDTSYDATDIWSNCFVDDNVLCI